MTPLDTLRALIEMAEASPGISELEFERGKLRLRVVMGGAGVRGEVPSNVVELRPKTRAAEPVAAPDDDTFQITSPLVGTFYSARYPGGPALAEEGGRVEKGAPLCLIETVKLFNEIPTDRAGRVVRVHVEDGQKVQYGDVLFTLAAG